MENKAVCGICGGDKWIQNNEYPLVRKCANPKKNKKVKKKFDKAKKKFSE